MLTYRDFDLEITEPERDDAGNESVRVRVASSPAGEQRRADSVRVEVSADLRKACGRLDRRELALDGLLSLGRELGDLLLPGQARHLFRQSLASLDPDRGLRLRLKLDTWGLADLPWEFAWLPPQPTAGPDVAPAEAQTADATGFLVLDPRISIVRYELLNEAPEADDALPGHSLRLIALFSAPRDPTWPPLDLDGEEHGLRTALAKRPEIGLEVVRPATLAGLERALLEGGQVFHFAGHGRFQAPPPSAPASVTGKGFLVLCDDAGKAIEVAAETVVVNLHGRGVRLAVLGACEGARRDRFNPWTGIAPALVRGGLPAVVAMQATLFDRSAVAFSARFYESLVAGLPIDAAVSAGRVAIFNEGGPGERDWGVPVLYLRTGSGILFPKASTDDREAEATMPLGRHGWLNAGLTAVAIAAMVAAFYAYVQPRYPSRWLWGSGLSLATVGGVVLAWLHWLAGDEARTWMRRSLRHPATTAVMAIAALALAATAMFSIAQRPVVLRVLPGVKLASHLSREGPTYSLYIWQGEPQRGPTWTIEPMTQAGATLGSSDRVGRLFVSRNGSRLSALARSYLAAKGVPETQLAGWLDRLVPEDPAILVDGLAPRRSNLPLHFKLIHGDQPVALLPPEIHSIEESEDALQILFIEPDPNP
ncbi:MAG: CHAT domain-containing protein [Thermoanaerobaculia bacterium]|nr:CHAT domain-containing protein [Thermoanaerobaculia bacterium]